MQKIWSQFFKKKMEREMSQYAHIELAFQKIRACSGNSDVREMVEKFMGREQTYATLLNQVSWKEKKYESLRMANEQKSEVLRQLRIENDNKKKLTVAKKDSEYQPQSNQGDEDTNELEYKTLCVETDQLQALFQQISERKKNIQLISDQVQGWVNRVASKLGGYLNDNSFKPRAPLLQKFQWVNGIINRELSVITAEQKSKHRGDGDDDNDSINARDFINDFSNDEFLNKNIRVRPVSGRSAGRH